MEAVSEIKRILGRRKPDTMFFGFTSGDHIEVLVDGDPDDMLQILVECFREVVGLMREDRYEQEEIREAAEQVMEDMRKAVVAPETGPRLVE